MARIIIKELPEVTTLQEVDEKSFDEYYEEAYESWISSFEQ